MTRLKEKEKVCVETYKWEEETKIEALYVLPKDRRKIKMEPIYTMTDSAGHGHAEEYTLYKETPRLIAGRYINNDGVWYVIAVNNTIVFSMSFEYKNEREEDHTWYNIAMKWQDVLNKYKAMGYKEVTVPGYPSL